ncbi:MAG TPA: LUD domain-containing protein [Candidatus Limnocylindrales bacterium]|nr:LUD domain-containing protein [Candidatus Limnocylindrales bacterium]
MAENTTNLAIVDSPRSVANKREKRRLLEAIRMSLKIQSPAVRRNTQTFNLNRYRATAAIPDYDALKDRARWIKEDSIARLPQLVEQLRETVRARGGHVFLAGTAEDACRYIRDVCLRHGAQLVVKGKSITSEEIRLNHVLQKAGIEVAESDLAEFILQIADEQPSHIIAPAVHYSRERITELFKRKFRTDLPLDTGEDLTKFARDILRDKFLHADVGITGANLIAADTGTIMLVESEGNIRMTSLLPPVHVAVAGMEKIIAARHDMATFLELLAPSATGQPLTSYTSFLSPPLADPPFALPGKPRKRREFHLVLIDHGRLRMREDPILRETLYCIRCSACLNSCANFQTVGGHAFGGETYSGGIGGSWEAGTGTLEDARFSELCTGCSRCVNQCPIRIDVPWLNENLRNRLNQAGETFVVSGMLSTLTGGAEEDQSAPATKLFFGNYHWFAEWGTRLAPLANAIASTQTARWAMERWLGLDRRRPLPQFPKQTLASVAEELPNNDLKHPIARAVLFADVFTNYGMVERGIAALRLLRELGVDVVVSESVSEGRAALSQGLLATAAENVRRAASLLEHYLEEGRDIIVLEPSSLAMFRRDARHLLESEKLIEKLRDHTFEPVEYVAALLERTGREPWEVFDVGRSRWGNRLFYHAHCQQKTIGCAAPTETLLREIGFDLVSSSVECCGMAGSFGYKKDFYDLSMAVGEDLFKQVWEADAGGERRVLLASGTSCTEQLRAGLNREVLHPIELLATILRAE